MSQCVYLHVFSDGRNRLEGAFPFIAPKTHVTLPDLRAKVLQQTLHVDLKEKQQRLLTPEGFV